MPTLTSLAKSCGWAAKFGPVGLKKILSSLPQNLDKNVLVGFETSDDAGVYRLNDEQALVSTVDFITPPVDDPLIYGQISAANSLSDIYAMGGNPLFSLNIVGFPSDVNKLTLEISIGASFSTIPPWGLFESGFLGYSPQTSPLISAAGRQKKKRVNSKLSDKFNFERDFFDMWSE